MATQSARKRPAREAMSKVDTAWLRMERATNPMMITGVLMFDEPMSHARLKQVIARRFLSYARFRQKAVDTPAGASWRDDRNFDLDWHVQHAALPGRGTRRVSDKLALERFVSQLASSPLDKSRPLWQFHLVEGFEGGSALVARIHHSYADGIALVQVLLSLTDTEREAGLAKGLARTWLKQEGVGAARRLGAVEKYARLGGRVFDRGMAMYRDPDLARLLAQEGGEIGRELVNALALSDDPPSLLRGRLGTSKRVAWAEPIDLDTVKAVGRAC
ncbi:MAG TPA: wax ester/triacylglycerol synthase domain-containing protein, partial [Luteimonas sp.]|nr:wax ester/triacylglycerol synthase domain-containing protein [Luteimonas sp.]